MNQKPTLFLALAFFALLCSTVAAQDTRTWNSADGRFTVKAKLMKVSGDSVALKRETGKVVQVKLSLLSPADQTYVRGLRASKTKAKTPDATNGGQGDSGIQIPGVFSIPSPGNGFSWNAGSQRVVDGIQAYRMLCSKKGSAANIRIEVEVRKANSDAEKAKIVKERYNKLLVALSNAKFADVKTPKLTMKPPLPDVVQYAVSGTQADGKPAAIRMFHLFNENTYSFQIFAPTAAEADLLSSVVGRLSELGSTPIPSIQQLADGRYQHNGFGFSFLPPKELRLIESPSKRVSVMFGDDRGANITFECLRRPSNFDLNKVVSQKREANGKSLLTNYEDLGVGDLQVGGQPGQWLVLSHEIQGVSLTSVQYCFANGKWVYVATATTRGEDYDDYRSDFDAAVQDIRFAD